MLGCPEGRVMGEDGWGDGGDGRGRERLPTQTCRGSEHSSLLLTSSFYLWGFSPVPFLPLHWKDLTCFLHSLGTI